MRTRRLAVLGMMLALGAAGPARAQQVNPADIVARGKLDLARFLMQSSKYNEAGEVLIEVLKMGGLSAPVRGQAYLMTGNLSMRVRDYKTARLAFQKVLGQAGATDEDRKAAQLGLSLLDMLEDASGK